MTTAAIHSGSCLCGAVQFRLVEPVKFVAHCHCSICRRAHGAPFVTWVGVPEKQFQLVEGKDLATYRSSAEAERSFCRNCGSPMFFRGTRWPGEVHVARALVASTSLPKPQAHVFVSDAAEWVPVDASLPRLGGPSGTEKIS